MPSNADNAAFSAALEECLRRAAAGAAIEACTAGYPEAQQQALRDALTAAQTLRGAPREPGDAFAARLEHRLRGAVAVRRQHPSWWQALVALLAPGAWGRPALAGALVLLVLAGTGVGAVQASEGSLPDNPLYAVKTTVERVNVAVASTEPAKLEVRLKQIPQQLSDFINASKGNRPEPMVQRLVARVTETLGLAVDYAVAAQEDGDADPNRRVRLLIRSLKNRIAQAPATQATAALAAVVEELEERLPPLPRPVRPVRPGQPPAGAPAPR